MNHYTSTFNGFVTRFGLDPDQFDPTPLEPIVDDDHFVLKRFIYHLNQRSEPRG